MTNSIALLATQSTEMTMTLKEITDLLKVRHDNAMQTVKLMMLDTAFGYAPEIQERYNSGKNVLVTYALNKRQSIAVAARLNTSLLMNISFLMATICKVATLRYGGDKWPPYRPLIYTT